MLPPFKNLIFQISFSSNLFVSRFVWGSGIGIDQLKGFGLSSLCYRLSMHRYPAVSSPNFSIFVDAKVDLDWTP